MDFSFTVDQQALRDLALKIIGDHAEHERLKTIEASEEWFDRKLWEELAKASLLGVAIPQEYGGQGLSFVDLCILLESMGRNCAPIPLWPTLVLGSLPITRFGSEAQKRKYLPGVAEGKLVLTAALVDTISEDPFEPAVTARKKGKEWVLSGEKMCVPVAHIADMILVTAKIDSGQTGMFLVDRDNPGIRLERQQTTSGEPHFIVTLCDVSVGSDGLLGDPRGCREQLRWFVERAIAALCAIEVGVTERALRMTAEYTSTREQFGKPLAKFQAVAQRAADAFIDVEAIRWTAWQAVWRLSEELPASDEVAIAKFWAGEGGHRVVYAAQHLHGGIGLDLDYPLFRSYLWSKQIELMLGSATQQLVRLGAALAADPAAAELAPVRSRGTSSPATGELATKPRRSAANPRKAAKQKERA